jgi:hypothetical protein
MIRKIKDLLKNTTLYDWIKAHRQKNILLRWEKDLESRKGPLPHIFKQFTIKDYANKFKCLTLVESGTFEGDMVRACLHAFSRIYSVELDDYYYQRAAKLFKNQSHVTILHGDSGERLSVILKDIDSRSIFWLDGHYSAGATAKGDLDTPIAKEIESILNHRVNDHVILIDDARCFDGTNDYPRLDRFIQELYSRRSDIKIETYNDIIRITPNKLVVD